MFFVLLLIVLLPFYYYPFGPSQGTGTLVRYVGAVCLAYAGFRTARRGTIPRFWRLGAVRWYLMFVGMVFISYFRVDRPFQLEYNPILTHSSMLALLFILFATVDSMKSLRWMLLVELGAEGLGGLYLIREWQVAHGWQTGYRGGHMVGDGNLFSIGVAAAVPIAIYLSQKNYPKWQRIYCIGCALASTGAIIIDGSRGGLLGIAAALSLVAWNSRKRVRNLIAGFTLLLLFNVAYPHSPLQRLLHPSEGDKFGTDARLMQWRAGLGMIRDHPLTGVGYGLFKSTMGRYVPRSYDTRNMAHNAFLFAAAEMGLPALIAFLGLCFSTYRGLSRVKLSKSPPLIRDATIGLKCGMGGVFVAICFVSALQEKELYFLFFLAMCLPLVPYSIRERRDVPELPAKASEPDMPIVPQKSVPKLLLGE